MTENVAADSFRFDSFCLDPADRRLTRDGVPIELSGRYLDALALLVSEPGRLVTKDRFMEEVWRGIPVTDEALTQCVRTLRRQLGDDASHPRLIETVPKHGYRFIGAVETGAAPVADIPIERVPTTAESRRAETWRQLLWLGTAGTIGGGIAGLIGGFIYGFVGVSQPVAPAMGAASVLLVLVCLTLGVALMGGAGVSLGIAAAGVLARRISPWMIFGGAAGGLVVGAFVKLIGSDAFDLLFGRSPGDITGAAEGVVLGGAIGLAVWLAARAPGYGSVQRGLLFGALAGGAAGLAIALAGGTLLGGSLDLLSHQFPGSRLELGRLGAVFGETSFGPIAEAVTGALEGALFSAGVVGAMILAGKRFRPNGLTPPATRQT